MNEISLEEYKNLSDHEKYDMVFRQGEFIDFTVGEEINFVLYSLYNFFVEVEYDSIKNKINAIDCFIDGKKLDRHLK